jgi:hypothetical protein
MTPANTRSAEMLASRPGVGQTATVDVTDVTPRPRAGDPSKVEAASMPIPSQDVSAARRAARDLVRAVEHLKAQHGDSVDMRRLLADAQRISEDLDILAGPDASEPGTGEPIMIPDHDYPPEFWSDADRE